MDMVKLIRNCRYSFFAAILLVFVSCDTSEQDFEKTKQLNSVEAYSSFIAKHPKSILSEEARDSVVRIYGRMRLKEIPASHQDSEIQRRLQCLIEHQVDSLYEMAEQENSIQSWQQFAYAVPSDYLRDAYDRRAQLVNEAYSKAEHANTVAAWKEYKETVPYTDVRDADERIRELEEIAAWSTESKAWHTASTRGTITAFRKYLELYPKGSHARQAEKKLIDLEVASVFAGEHGVLPQMDRGYSTGASYSIIEIENRTQYDLTVSYSGPDSKRVVVSPHATRKVNIGNGYYRVAASVGHGVIPFAGTEQLDGSYFSSSFYISTTRSRY